MFNLDVGEVLIIVCPNIKWSKGDNFRYSQNVFMNFKKTCKKEILRLFCSVILRSDFESDFCKIIFRRQICTLLIVTFKCKYKSGFT